MAARKHRADTGAATDRRAWDARRAGAFICDPEARANATIRSSETIGSPLRRLRTLPVQVRILLDLDPALRARSCAPIGVVICWDSMVADEHIEQPTALTLVLLHDGAPYFGDAVPWALRSLSHPSSILPHLSIGPLVYQFLVAFPIPSIVGQPLIWWPFHREPGPCGRTWWRSAEPRSATPRAAGGPWLKPQSLLRQSVSTAPCPHLSAGSASACGDSVCGNPRLPSIGRSPPHRARASDAA